MILKLVRENLSQVEDGNGIPSTTTKYKEVYTDCLSKVFLNMWLIQLTVRRYKLMLGSKGKLPGHTVQRKVVEVFI